MYKTKLAWICYWLSLVFLLHTQSSYAQEKPSLFLTPFDYTTSYLQNVCDRHQSYYNATLELKDALRGFELHALVRVGDFARLDENGALSVDNPGLSSLILDELASRAGFTWRDSFAITSGPDENHTWAELLEWSTDVYDLSAEYFTHTIDRYRRGIAFPEGLDNGYLIMVGLQPDSEQEEQQAALESCTVELMQCEFDALIMQVGDRP